MTGMSNMGSNPKMWAWGAGILGIILVVCGFLSQSPPEDSPSTCKSSHYTWASVIIGFIMLLAGFMSLMKMSKKPSAAAGAAAGIGMTDMGGGDAGAGPATAPGDMPPM